VKAVVDANRETGAVLIEAGIERYLAIGSGELGTCVHRDWAVARRRSKQRRRQIRNRRELLCRLEGCKRFGGLKVVMEGFLS
jgi:hypothetical protein